MNKKFKTVTPELIKKCTDDLEFYDKHGYFPGESKFRRLIRKIFKWWACLRDMFKGKKLTLKEKKRITNLLIRRSNGEEINLCSYCYKIIPKSMLKEDKKIYLYIKGKIRDFCSRKCLEKDFKE